LPKDRFERRTQYYQKNFTRNCYNSVYEIETKFNEGGLVVPMSWTEKWDNNAQTMINIIKGLDYKLYNEIYKETQTK
jgi:hypothetical protein